MNNSTFQSKSLSKLFDSRFILSKPYILLCDMFIYFIDITNTVSGLVDDYAKSKKCNSTQKNINESSDLIHATIGLAIVAVLIIVIYLYTHLLERY